MSEPSQNPASSNVRQLADLQQPSGASFPARDNHAPPSHEDMSMSTTRIVYIEAYACDDHGDGPTYARLDVTPEFKAQLRKLQGLVQDNGLSEARVYTGEAAWEPEGIDDELTLSGDELVVTHSAFWFTAHVKHQDYFVETRAQDIHDFLSLVEDGETGPVYLGYDPDELREIVEDGLEESSEDKAAA